MWQLAQWQRRPRTALQAVDDMTVALATGLLKPVCQSLVSALHRFFAPENACGTRLSGDGPRPARSSHSVACAGARGSSHIASAAVGKKGKFKRLSRVRVSREKRAASCIQAMSIGAICCDGHVWRLGWTISPSHGWNSDTPGQTAILCCPRGRSRRDEHRRMLCTGYIGTSRRKDFIKNRYHGSNYFPAFLSSRSRLMLAILRE